MKTVFLIFLFAVSLHPFSGIAQNQKVGHVDIYEMAMLLPEQKEATMALQTRHDQFAKELQELQKHIEQKIAAYEKEADSLSEIIRQVREQEIKENIQRVEEYKKAAVEQLNAMDAELSGTIKKKVNEAVLKVANENGFSYILNTNPKMISMIPEQRFVFHQPWSGGSPFPDEIFPAEWYAQPTNNCEATVVYFSNGIDVTDLVKKELGLE
jgi:outer membrane protein